LLTFIAIMGLGTWAETPAIGASAQETPDIKTVPDLDLIATPTNTPFPTPTPAADERGDDDDASSDGGSVNSNNRPAAANPPAPNVAPVGSNVTAIGGSQLITTTGPLSLTVPVTGVVISTVVNLYAEPRLQARIVDTLFRSDTVLIRAYSPDGAWWLVCCGVGQGRTGWVLAQSIRTTFVMPSLPARPAPIATPLTPNNATLLDVEMRPAPAFVWQGQQVQIEYVITNRGPVAAEQIRLRNELPSSLRYLSVQAEDGGRFRQSATAQEHLVFTVDWSSLPPNAKVTVTLTLQVADDLPAGALIDNLALVTARNASAVTVGLTLAMPPTLPPQFKVQ
jgi:hypothetical protein